jgi:hypothetical protein
MSNTKNFLSAMKADELRRLHEGQTRIDLPANHSYKYQKYLEQRFPNHPGDGGSGGAASSTQDYLIDNLGQLYNDDSIAQLTHAIPSTAITVPVEPIVRWVVINSEDRDWVSRTDENPYSFGVHLGQTSQFRDPVSGVLRNIELTINQHFTNISKLECTSVIVPNRQLANKFRPNARPHLLIGLGQSTDALYGSSKATNSALTVLVPKLPVPAENFEVRYLEYTTTAQMAKDYLTPEATLNRLYVNITRPDGYNPWLDDAASDTFSILVIYMPDLTQPYLDVITQGFFNPEDFIAGDIVKFRDYVFRETVTSGYKEAVQFNQFINRQAGHIIQFVGQYPGIQSPPYVGQMFNYVRILAPGANSTQTGLWTFNSWFSDPVNMGFIEKFTDFDDPPTPTSTKDNSGHGLNTNTQTTTVLKITYLDKNAGQLVKKIK